MVKNINSLHKERMTFSERAADKLATFVGSWRFILVIAALLLIWISINILAFGLGWDPYPFILLNLVLSVIAAVQGPVILMSQNRMEKKDRLRSELDYESDLKSEVEITHIKKELTEIKSLLSQSKVKRAKARIAKV